MAQNPADPATSAPETEVSRTMIVQNKMGIHARPAAMIVRAANKYKAEVYVEKDSEEINGKSIMGLMMLAAAQGTELIFKATGEGAETVLDEIDELFKGRFDEK